MWSALISVIILMASGCCRLFAYARYAAQGGPARHHVDCGLPFRNTSNDPEQDYLSEGISEALIGPLVATDLD